MMYIYFQGRLAVTDAYFSYGIKATAMISKKHRNAT